MCIASTDPGGPYRCSADTRNRLQSANKALDKAEEALTKAKATFGATPWRPESEGWHTEYGIPDPHASEEFREWEDSLKELAGRHDVDVEGIQHANGVWQGESEPSALLTATADTPDKLRDFASDLAARYEQDAVMVTIENPAATTASLTLPQQPEIKDALTAQGVQGWTEVDGTIRIDAAPADVADIIHRRFGGSYVCADTEFVSPTDDDRAQAALHSPIKEIQAMRTRHQLDHGLTPQKMPSLGDSEAIAAANAYQNGHDATDQPPVQKSYAALRSHIAEQYNQLVDAGYRIEPWESDGQPYPNSASMLNDLRTNRHLHYSKTENAGQTGLPSNHPMNVPITVSDGHGGTKTILANDAFRGVHNIYSHGDGYQFGPRGEQRAWWTHRNSLPKEAHLALWNETRAQSCWTNAGPHMQTPGGTITPKSDPGWLPSGNRPYPQQRIVIPGDNILV